MEKYEKYKDSGIEWIGEIPEHWETKRFSHLFSFSRGLGITKQDLKDQGIPCVNYGEIHSKYGFSVNPEIHQLKFVEEAYLDTAGKSLLKRGDFVFADTSEDIEGSGNFTVLDSDIPTFAGYHTIIARHEDGNHYKYLAYCFDSTEFRNQIRSAVSGIKVFSITNAILKGTKVQLPSTAEQTAIAHYLDRKTAEIDELIADKKRLLELYEEEKTAIINQAVTKGINPNAPMKDSGIEWLGEIPEHWSSVSLKWVSKIYSGGTPSKNNSEFWQDGTIPWLNSGTVNQGDITEPSEYITEEALNNSSAKWIPEKALVMALAGQGKTKGMVAQVQFKTTCNQSLGVIVPNEKINNRFLMYWLRNNYQNIRNLGGGDKRDGINLEMIGGIPLPLPQYDEQTKIVEHIEFKFSELIKKTEITNKLIDLLTEYRTALISEVVTGKIKVTE